MPVYISLLRGVNVGGARKLPMSELSALFKSLGFQDVRTYIQSGNVIGSSDELNSRILDNDIEAEIRNRFEFETQVMIRTPDELSDVVERVPFSAEQLDKVSVAFLAEVPLDGKVDTIVRIKDPAEEFQITGREVYLYYPNGQGRSRMTNAVLERALGVSSTVRNWRTVNKLLEMAGE